MQSLSESTRTHLRGVSVATICTALFKRGLRNQFIQDVRPLNPNLPNMVGEAFTLRYIPAREDLNTTPMSGSLRSVRRSTQRCPITRKPRLRRSR